MRALLRIASVALALALGLACVEREAAHADLVLTGGKVFTADPSRPWVEALAVRGARIVAVGSDADVARMAGLRTRRVDLAGRVVIPGLNDAHAHLGPRPAGIELELAAPAGAAPGIPDPSLDEVVAALEAAHRTEPVDRRFFAVVGSAVLDDPRATRDLLDRIALGRFVLLQGWTGHGSVSSSAALATLGISDEQADPEAGFFGRMPGSRRVSGLAHEYAHYPLQRLLAESEGEASAVQYFRDFAVRAARFGITSVQDMSGWLSIEKAATALRAANVPIRIRVIRLPMTGAGARDARTGAGSGVKWILDGTPIERLAALREPYSDRPGWLGRMNFSEPAIDALLAQAVADDEQVMLHCVGDACVALLLARMEASGGAGAWAPRRARIEHGDGLMPDLIPRARALGIVVVQNPIHFTFPDVLVARLGTARARQYQPLRSLLAAGVPIAIGSDGPLNPFLQIQCAVLHPNNPAESISVEQAVAAYTRGSAFAEVAENEKGTLAPGYLADFAVLSRDIFTSPPALLPETESVLTVVGGRVVYEAPR